MDKKTILFGRLYFPNRCTDSKLNVIKIPTGFLAKIVKVILIFHMETQTHKQSDPNNLAIEEQS